MSEFNDRVHHFYAQTDGTIAWPNSAEGDLLKIAHRELAELQSKFNDLKQFLEAEATLADHRAARIRLVQKGL